MKQRDEKPLPKTLDDIARALVALPGWERPPGLMRLDLTAPDVAGHLLAQLIATGRFYCVVQSSNTGVFRVQCSEWPYWLRYAQHQHLGAAVALAIIVVTEHP